MGHLTGSVPLVLTITVLAYQKYRVVSWGLLNDYLLSTLVVLAIEAVLLFAVYRLKFHPLARYPGPWWAALTDWYTVYHLSKGDRHLNFYKLHQSYDDIGKFVRYGPNRVSINSTTAAQDIYSVHSNVQKSQAYATFKHFFGDVDMSMTIIDKKKHAFRRRINVKALTPKAIKDLEDKILENVRYFCHGLVDEESHEWSSAKDMTKLVGYLVSDIMGDVTFSRNWNVLRDAENRHFVEELPKGVSGIHLTGHMPWLLKFGLDKLLFNELVQGVLRLSTLSKSVSDWRVAQGNSLPTRDLFAALLDAEDPETGRCLDREELVSEAGLLIIGGSDTTITATTATIFYLLHSPTSLEHLRHEICTTFAKVEDIRIGTELASCRYLLACIDESMRLSPPVGSLLPREVLPGGLKIDDEWFPPGVDVGVPHYTLHHNESYFADPFDFKPERWLSRDDRSKMDIESSSDIKASLDADVELAQSAFTPFGIGRTSCVGKYLAYQEMSLIIARMLWLYDMRTQPGSTMGEGSPSFVWGRMRKDEFQLQDRFVSTHEGPMVEFRARKSGK